MTGDRPGQVTDVVTVTAQDDEQTGVSANDDATVTITDVPSLCSAQRQQERGQEFAAGTGGTFVGDDFHAD
ncbi:MAG: hypothetical protein R2851_04545 [Caldilineaceae bacterium]